MAKYDALKEFLAQELGRTLTMRFDDNADLVGGLPYSAYRHRLGGQTRGGDGTCKRMLGWGLDGASIL